MEEKENIKYKRITYTGSVCDIKAKPSWEFEIYVDYAETGRPSKEEINSFMKLAYAEACKTFDSYVIKDTFLMMYSLDPNKETGSYII